MKTLILWKRKRTRKPKMVGTATANCSTLTICDLSAMAERGDGKLYIVDAPTAAHARAIITAYESDVPQDIGRAGLTSQIGPNIVAIGVNAVRAIAGASEGKRHWDARIRRDGRVKIRDSKALGRRSDDIEPNMADYFGQGF